MEKMKSNFLIIKDVNRKFNEQPFQEHLMRVVPFLTQHTDGSVTLSLLEAESMLINGGTGASHAGEIGDRPRNDEIEPQLSTPSEGTDNDEG
ncbi:hypothetical protein F2Q69_00036920 [Brassica cretica]|uniref:Uncharacterized protein n=1 Tax=Brassica cretica TaxID=69181 RepID=A0A8S9SF66_BRACR|nr:hypothetical protein F2Q69_00036920 [Brassica cretica]